MTYKTATNLAVFPTNSESEVMEASRILGYHLDQKFMFVSNPLSAKKGAKHPFPTPISVRDALEKFVDLRGPLRKKTLKDLSAYI